jgi:hypothetical protein
MIFILSMTISFTLALIVYGLSSDHWSNLR